MNQGGDSVDDHTKIDSRRKECVKKSTLKNNKKKVEYTSRICFEIHISIYIYIYILERVGGDNSFIKELK